MTNSSTPAPQDGAQSVREADEAKRILQPCTGCDEAAGEIDGLSHQIAHLRIGLKAARDALEEIASYDCGCVPCTGQCLKGEAAEIELEARMAIARSALAGEASPSGDDPACTDCGGSGVTFQTERQCSCVVAAPAAPAAPAAGEVVSRDRIATIIQDAIAEHCSIDAIEMEIDGTGPASFKAAGRILAVLTSSPATDGRQGVTDDHK